MYSCLMMHVARWTLTSYGVGKYIEINNHISYTPYKAVRYDQYQSLLLTDARRLYMTLLLRTVIRFHLGHECCLNIAYNVMSDNTLN